MDKVDHFLAEFIRSDKCRALLEREWEEIRYPVSLTYAMERWVILHVKLFQLEDEVRKDFPDSTIGKLKRRIDYLNGEQRPRLVEAIGQMVTQALQGEAKDVAEPSMKKYGSDDDRWLELATKLSDTEHEILMISQALAPIPRGGRTWSDTRQLAKDMRQTLQSLVKKLEEIGENEEFKSVWTMYALKGLTYNGPTYEKELKAARKLLGQEGFEV